MTENKKARLLVSSASPPRASDTLNRFTSGVAEAPTAAAGGRCTPGALTSAAPFDLDVHEAGVRDAFRAFVDAPSFSCLGARAALHRPNHRIGVYGRLASPEATHALALDLAAFAASDAEHTFSTFVAVFAPTATAPEATSEATFEAALWNQLQRLHEADAQPAWDPAVSDDPDDPHFSFSFAGTAFFVVGLHPGSVREARRFGWPALAFNPHGQFERLRADGRFSSLRDAIRVRELALQGSLNPNLSDFGERSDARQYSGRAVDDAWGCPFHRTRS